MADRPNLPTLSAHNAAVRQERLFSALPQPEPAGVRCNTCGAEMVIERRAPAVSDTFSTYRTVKCRTSGAQGRKEL